MTLPIQGCYSIDWHHIAQIVKAEADWRCVRCGHDHDPPNGRCLTVHHFDGNKANNERWNLMALCQVCHLHIQAKVDPRCTWMFNVSTWSMPYIAGFYEANPGFIQTPRYDLRDWIGEYEREIGPWPEWAPRLEMAS